MKVWVICCDSDGEPDVFMGMGRVFFKEDSARNYCALSKGINNYNFVVKEGKLEVNGA
jgi:hypothetical protein